MARHPHRLAYALLLLLLQGCTQTGIHKDLGQHISASSMERKVLAVYEPWFGHPSHISVGYSSQDPLVIRKQIDAAKGMGISGFVVDWYGDREPFLDRAYALIQSIAAEKQFKVAMMYDETQPTNGQATDDALAAFEKFHRSYLAPDAPGRDAYLTYNGRPMIFIFPKSMQTDWNRIREVTNQWENPPLLIYEDRSTRFASLFDWFYAWVNPGKSGFAADGSNWGEDYLRDFYQRMQSKYPDKITVGGAWAGFDDSKASWGLNRHISQRCGQTFADTLKISLEYSPLPFLLIATWNDYEEGSAIERGLGKCDAANR